MPIPLIAAALAPTVVKGISSLLQIRKGSKMAKRLKRPTYEIPQEIADNVAIADNMAQVGMGQNQYNNAEQGIQRNVQGGLRRLGRSANPSAGIASIVRAGNDAQLGLDAQDEAARTANKRYAFGARSALAGQRLAKQQYDKFGKYNEEADAAASTIGAGKQNFMNSLSEASQIALLAGQDGDNGTSSTSSQSPYISSIFKKKKKAVPSYFEGY